MLLTKFHDPDNSNVLINNCFGKLKDYLGTQNYPEQIVDDICDLKFLHDNPSYYLYYPYLFNTAFNFYDDDILKKLAIAGFLYYKSIIYIDDIFDNKKGDNVFHKYTISNICQEETIKLLSDIFNINSNFWKIWNKRKFEYFKAYQLDKVSHNIKSYNDYKVLADYKSSFGKIAIDSLYILSREKQKGVYNKILDSHSFFYVAFQILDDILDYEEDSQNNQFNISKFELERKIKNLSTFSIRNQKSLLYTEGITNTLHDKALVYLHQSINLCNKLDAPKWKYELQSLYNTIITHKLNIYRFLKYSSAINNLEIKYREKITSEKAIEKAKNYISIRQEVNGCWEDYFNNAGVSDVWTTAFISYFLSKNNLLKTNLQKSKEFLIPNYKVNHLLGYNSHWIPDADSTSFGILSLKSLGYTFNNQELKKWYSYQNNDGGFSKYNNKLELLASLNSKQIKNVNGCLNSHFCVSAVSYLVFIELNKIHKKSFESLRNYLIIHLSSNDGNLSYWWSEDIYAIYYILLGTVQYHDEQIISICEKKIEKIVKKETLNLFYSGLLLSALCLTETLFSKCGKKVKELVNEILLNQYTDGSWNESYSLRLPHPSVLNPNDEKIVWRKANKGTNIIVKDHNRIFTTVSCLTALKNYEERIS